MNDFVKNEKAEATLEKLTEELKTAVLEKKIKVDIEGTIWKIKKYSKEIQFDLCYEKDRYFHVTLKASEKDGESPFDYFEKYKLEARSRAEVRGVLCIEERFGHLQYELQGDWIAPRTERNRVTYSTKTEGGKLLPDHPPRIALISNPSSQGAGDFRNKLLKRGYPKKLVWYDSRLYGDEAIEEISRGIKEINEKHLADVICIVRGGGHPAQLHYVFDSKKVCEAILQSEIPVFVGIGHYDDTVYAEDVSDAIVNHFSAALTPTDLANKFLWKYREFLKKYVPKEDLQSKSEENSESSAAPQKEEADPVAAVSTEEKKPYPQDPEILHFDEDEEELEEKKTVTFEDAVYGEDDGSLKLHYWEDDWVGGASWNDNWLRNGAQNYDDVEGDGPYGFDYDDLDYDDLE